jgi:hypothetical protein
VRVDEQVYWQEERCGESKYWHERVRAFTQASPTNLTSARAAYSLAFASPSRYGGVVSSIEQDTGRFGPLLWRTTSRLVLGTSLHNETNLSGK